MGLMDIVHKAMPKRSIEDAPAQPDIFYLDNGVGVAIVRWNDHIAATAAMSHPVIYRAIDKLAASVQQIHWFVEPDPDASASVRSGKTKLINDLQELLDNPNDHMTAPMFRYWMTLNFAAYGRVPIKVGFSATNPTRPNGLYPMQVSLTKALINSRGIVDGYRYGNGETAQVYRSKLTWKPGDGNGFMDQIWKPGLMGQPTEKDVNSPLNVVGLPAQVMKSLLVRAIQTAEGHPNVRYMVSTSKVLTVEQKRAIGDYLNADHGPQGPNAGKVPILQNAGDIEIHKLDNDLSDIHSKMPSDDMARIIFGAFGIPIALTGMGAADSAKFASNYVESRLSFWQDTVVPMYDNPLRNGLSRLICPPGLRISSDYDTIPALVGGRISSMREMDRVGFLTVNEKRELFGWGPTTEISPQANASNTFVQGDPNGTQQ